MYLLFFFLGRANVLEATAKFSARGMPTRLWTLPLQANKARRATEVTEVLFIIMDGRCGLEEFYLLLQNKFPLEQFDAYNTKLDHLIHTHRHESSTLQHGDIILAI